MHIVRHLPADLPAALFVTLHIPPSGPSMLPDILTRKGSLPASHARNGAWIEPGRIYIAPPDHHLLVKRGCVRLGRGPKENSARPAVDPMFRTAARAYGARVVGVVLTGNLDDGTAGALVVKLHGGSVIVQDPADALYPGMPSSAVENVAVDHVLPLPEIAPCLVKLAHRPVEGAGAAPEEELSDIAEMTMNELVSHHHEGTPANLSCPDCGGTLWEQSDDQFTLYRCRVGHGFTEKALLSEQKEALETALWSALRALEENASLTRRMAVRMDSRQQPQLARRFAEQAEETERRAMVIRTVLMGNEAEVESAD